MFNNYNSLIHQWAGQIGDDPASRPNVFYRSKNSDAVAEATLGALEQNWNKKRVPMVENLLIWWEIRWLTSVFPDLKKQIFPLKKYQTILEININAWRNKSTGRLEQTANKIVGKPQGQ